MRRPRMTTRRWMIAVAVVASVMSGIVAHRIKRRQDDFLRRSTAHARSVVAIAEAKVDIDESIKRGASLMDGRVRQLTVVGQWPDGRPGQSPMEMLKAALSRQRGESQRMDRAIRYHAALARKYEFAALHPWLPVEADPPEPE